MDTPDVLFPRCGFCETTQPTKICAGCKVMRYCSMNHKKDAFEGHQLTCKPVKKARTAFNNQARKFAKEDLFGKDLPDDPFTTSPGDSWNYYPDRSYLAARYNLAEALIEMSTHDSITESLEHCMYILRLGNTDKFGARYLVPFLMLRLGRDQECYDFVKWWEIEAYNGGYNFDNPRLTYLGTKNADAFEPIDVFFNDLPGARGRMLFRLPRLPFLTALTLLKVKLYLDLDGLSDKSGEVLPCPSKIITQDSALMQKGHWKEELKALEAQISTLVDKVNETNPHFWPTLVDQDFSPDDPPDEFSAGSEEEVETLLSHSYAAWEETEGAIETIHDVLREKALI